MSRFRPGALTAPPPSTTRWTRTAFVVAAIAALILGVIPGFGPTTADAGTATLGNFRTTVTVNKGQSDLRPGGHVRYDISATNTQDRDTVTRVFGREIRTPNYSALLLYGVDAPAGLTYRASGGQIYSPGNWEQGGTFTGGLAANLSNIDEIGDLLGNIGDLGPASVRGQDTRTGWISFDIPDDARGGNTYRAGARVLEARVFPSPSTPAVRTSSNIDSFTLNAVGSQTEVTVPPTVARVGQPVDLTASVTAAAGSNTPTGTVTFSADGQSETATLTGGVATASMTFATTGSKDLTVTFTPASGAQWATSTGTGTVQVEAEATQTGLELDAVEITSGDALTATATVTPADAEGAVEFTVGDQTQTVPVTAGSATAEFTLDVPEDATVAATFIPADPQRYTSSTDAKSVTVNRELTQTTLELDAVEILSGDTLSATAQVTPADAEGEIEFAVDGQTQTIPVSEGAATAEFTINTPGDATVIATFIPADQNRYSPSSDAAVASVETGLTELDLGLPEDVVLNEPTVLTARVAPGDADGTVAFTIDGMEHAAEVVDGVAKVEHTFTEPGEYPVTAVFTPANGERYSASEAEGTITVEPETDSVGTGSLGSTGGLTDWATSFGAGSLEGLVGSTTQPPQPTR